MIYKEFCEVWSGFVTDSGDYKKSLSKLKKKYPDTSFVHFTLPITTVPSGFKVFIKNLIGREVPEQDDDLVRLKYNELLRNEYAGKAPVFDIAFYESVAPEANIQYSFNKDGKNIEVMAPENTSDGGHLSDAGKRWVAEQFIIFLVNLD